MLWAIDTETALIARGRAAPPLACVSWANATGSGVWHHSEAHAHVKRLLESGDSIVGHNMAFDSAVLGAAYPDLLPLIFAAYDADRITDTMLREQLIDIALGQHRKRWNPETEAWAQAGYSLADLAQRHLGKILEKDIWRLGYGELIEKPLVEWPQGAIDYARLDAETTLSVAQEQEATGSEAFLRDQFRQARAAFALQLQTVYGLRVNGEKLAAFAARVRSETETLRGHMLSAGILRPDGTRNLTAVRERIVASSPAYKRTPKGGVSTDAESCRDSGDPVLVDYARFSALGSMLSGPIPSLEEIARDAKPVLHPGYVTLVDTGRTASRGDKLCGINVQNMRREPGLREVFEPRKGNVFFIGDFAGFELHCMAEAAHSIAGFSNLGTALNEGRDVHLWFAAVRLGADYNSLDKADPVVKLERQLSKCGNFGFAGGMGPAKFVAWARKAFQIEISEDDVKRLKSRWLEAFPEFKQYFKHAERLSRGGETTIEQLTSGRIRGGCSYTEVCNGLFQGLGADAAKAALWETAKLAYLHGVGRPVLFIHDEIVAEVYETEAFEFGEKIASAMETGAKTFLPTYPPRVDWVLSRVWSKDAQRVELDGKVVPWEP